MAVVEKDAASTIAAGGVTLTTFTFCSAFMLSPYELIVTKPTTGPVVRDAAVAL
jgi:hypothetical protein